MSRPRQVQDMPTCGDVGAESSGKKLERKNLGHMNKQVLDEATGRDGITHGERT